MKIICGGGGVDADGNTYTLPEVEREVPDDYFKKLAKVLKATPRPTFMLVDPEILAALREAK